jgi:hypothetical protein
MNNKQIKKYGKFSLRVGDGKVKNKGLVQKINVITILSDSKYSKFAIFFLSNTNHSHLTVM